MSLVSGLKCFSRAKARLLSNKLACCLADAGLSFVGLLVGSIASCDAHCPMASSFAVRYIASKPGSLSPGLIQLQLRVKTGTGKTREGILAVTDTAIEVGVTAQPRHGEANKEVVEVLSQAIGIQKSRFQFLNGLRSKDKIVAVPITEIQGDGIAYAETILNLLRKGSYRTPPP